MNRNQMEGAWQEFRGKVREQWGRLTDDDLDVINGKHDQLIGKIQQRYGMVQEEAERSVREWWDRIAVEG